MIINDWNILPTKLFKKQHEALILTVKKLRDKDTNNYKNHPKTILLACIQHAIKKDVPSNPNHKKFRLGKTLGSVFTHWRRVKKNMPKRYRMFFRFHSNVIVRKNANPEKWIIFAWFNDEDTLRKAKSKNDVYAVFKSLLINNSIPDNWDELYLEAKNIKSIGSFWK